MPALSHQVGLPPRYRVVRHIANGGMATVWAAEDSVLERLVAVKVLAPGYAVDQAARRRFTREARAAARVSDHPNVVTIFDIGEHEGQAFIVMEHFAGGTVADRLRAGDVVPVPLALRWLAEAASALDAAHAADIVHRDVKPGNLLLDENGRLAVGDFGIASLAGETAVTAAGQVLGTAAYLSPEQARGHAATPASDRYSLAVVAYELLCGKRPFAGDTPMAQARARIERDPITLTGACAAADEPLRWGLSREPADRPPSAAAFVKELQRALGPAGEPTRVTTVIPAVPAPAPEPDRRSAGPEWVGAGNPRFARGGRRRDREPAAQEPAAGRPPVPVPAAAGAQSERPRDPVARRRHPHRRAFMLAALAAGCLVVGAGAALISDDGNDGGRGTTAPRATVSKSQGAPTGGGTSQRADTPSTASSSTPAAATPPASSSTPATTTPAPAADARSAATLNNAGFKMLPGDPQGALPLLQAAVDKFRAQGDTKSLDYAFSLYNLGWALRLAGRPADAIPYLQERLRISDYKRGVVEKELATAQADAGVPATGANSGTGKAKKNKAKRGKGDGGPGGLLGDGA